MIQKVVKILNNIKLDSLLGSRSRISVHFLLFCIFASRIKESQFFPAVPDAGQLSKLCH